MDEPATIPPPQSPQPLSTRRSTTIPASHRAIVVFAGAMLAGAAPLSPGAPRAMAATAAQDAHAGETRDRMLGSIAEQLEHPNSHRAAEAIDALRRLRDPRLRPVFVHLASTPDPDRAVSALLGMADLEDPPRVDVVRLAELSNENARAHAVGLTLRLGYLDSAGLTQVANWPKLGDTLETLLLAELLGKGQAVSPARLAELSRSEEPLARTLAQLLEGELDEEAQRALAEQFLTNLGGREQTLERVLEPILLSLRRAGATGSIAFVLRIGEMLEGELAPEREVLTTLASLDPERARANWHKAYAAADSSARRFSLGLAALHSEGRMGQQAASILAAAEDPTLATIGAAALAIDSPPSQSTVDALIALLDTRYEQATGWVVDRGRDLPAEWRARFAAQLVRYPDRTADRSTRGAQLAREGARLLAQDDPSALGEELRRIAAEGNNAIVQAILLGIIESERHGRVWSHTNEPSWPSPRAGAMAAICAALFDLAEQQSPPPTTGEHPEQREIVWEDSSPEAAALTSRLIDAAAPGSPLDPPARAQAAWLALTRLEPGADASTRLLNQLGR
ncbi:MAG: hypothetical protein ACTS3F_08310 [Phycisphaerales bacterium]